MAAVSAAEMQSMMDSYVARYQSRYDNACNDYNAKSSALAAVSPSDREKMRLASKERDVALEKMNNAKEDLEEAKSYAQKEVAKAEKADQKELKKLESGDEGKGSKLKEIAKTGGLVVGGALAVGAFGVVKAGSWVIDKGKTSRLMMKNTGSYLAMSFAQNVLGWDGGRVPEDPTRRTWDPAIKESRKKGYCHGAEHQPSFI